MYPKMLSDCSLALGVLRLPWQNSAPEKNSPAQPKPKICVLRLFQLYEHLIACNALSALHHSCLLARLSAAAECLGPASRGAATFERCGR